MMNNNRGIENAYIMLRYIYHEINTRRFKDVDVTNISTLDDLYADIITKWCLSIAKEGLYKEYVAVEEDELMSPKGQIDLIKSISKNTQLRGVLICAYDEFSADVYINHVLKGTLQYLMYNDMVSKEKKNNIQKAMLMFGGVKSVDITTAHWKNIKYTNNNIRYKHLLEMCMDMVNENRLERSMEIDEAKRLFILFKKFLFNWYTTEYGVENEVMPFNIGFRDIDIESPVDTSINQVQKMTVVKTDKQTLVINIKLQDELILEDNRIQRRHLENFVADIREYKVRYKEGDVSGCLVYINIDKSKLNVDPISMNLIDDISVGTLVIDLYDQWRFIANKLDDIYNYFLGRTSRRKNIAKQVRSD